MNEGDRAMDPGSPVGTPLTQDSPTVSRTRHGLPEPMCSPIALDRSPPGFASPQFESPCVKMPCPSPSPASKRFVGVSNNARNDIYMKTLLNSPYHKSYTPLSATPGFSPAYQTPLRVTHPDKHESPHLTVSAKSQYPKSSSYKSPQPGVTSTPQHTQLPGSGKRFVTPKNVIANPFENGVDDLHLPAYMSPGFFTCASTPASEERKVFRWSIDELAELFPADIDVENTVHRTQNVPLDRETEERAQKAIEQFFANNLIAPSPWSDPKKTKKKTVLPGTPASQGSGSGQADEMMTELQGSIQKSLPVQQGAVDASCQTMLSLPVDFDLQKVLGAYMNQDSDEGNQGDMLSTSSLRRKLFFHGDTSSVAPSPVKGVSDDVEFEPCSPIFTKQTQPNFDHITPLKNTPAFSSSPIKSSGTPQYRRSSSDPEFLASPELSPIVNGNIHKSRSKSRSSGMFEPHPSNFDIISPIGNFDLQGQHSIMSPIPFEGLSPDDYEEKFRPKFEDSPGFSPIRPPKVPIRKILRKSQEESYIQEDICESDEEAESMTPVSTNQHIDSTDLTPVESISPIHRTPGHRISTTVAKSHGSIELQQKTMDLDTSRQRDNILTSSLCDTRDFTSSVSFQDDTHQQNSMSNQDTGYQTASLQSTNPESASLHTNLTNQFGSLPFNLTNQESLFHTSSLVPPNQEKAPVLNLSRHFSMIASQNNSLDEDHIETNSNNNCINSPPLFPKQKLLFMDDDEEDEDIGQHETPKCTVSVDVKFEDSALPDESVNEEYSHKHMDVDGVSGVESECVTSQEKVVMSRARQALAMANSMYPQDGCKSVSSRFAGMTSDMSDGNGVDTDKKQKQLSASELALSIIQRAGEDLARYGNIAAGKKTHELTMEGLHDSS